MMSPFRVIVVFLVLSVGGLALLPKLKIDLNPPPPDYKLYVSFDVGQASPNMVEQLATAPLENALSTLRDLKEIGSVSSYNEGQITLEFDRDTDMDYKRFELAMLLRQLYPRLDERVSFPLVSESYRNENSGVFMQYTLNAPMAPFELKKMGEELVQKPLSAIRELEAVSFYGASDLGIRVQYDEAKAVAYGITKERMVQMLQKQFGTYYPGMGQFREGTYTFLRVDRSIHKTQEIEDFEVENANGLTVKLKDIAKVSLEEQEVQSYYRINGQNFVSMVLDAREGVNKVDLGRKVKAEIAAISQNLPAGYTLRLIYDETEFLEKELSKVYQRSGLSILILIIFIFLINRNLRYLFVLFSGIVVNLFLAVLLIYFLDVPIHLYSLAGLTISFGLLVDNAIVMIDHLHKQGNRKVFLALLAASLTTICALLLVFFLPEEDQLNLLDFSVVISVTLGVSLVVALFFTPAMHSLVFGEGSQRKAMTFTNLRRRVKFFKLYASSIYWLTGKKKILAVLSLLAFGIPVFMLPAKWDDHTWYNETIGSDIYQDDMRPYVDKALGGGLRLFVQKVYERSSYREPEKTKLFVNANLAYGNTLDNMDFIIRDFENYLLTVEGVAMFTTRVMSGENARIEITFDDDNEKGSLPYILKARLSLKASDWSGVRWSIFGVGQGFSTGSGGSIPSFRVKMKGYNYEALASQAQVMADKLLTHARVNEVNTNERLSWRERASEEYTLYLNPSSLSQQGISAGQVASAIQNHAKSTRADLNLAVSNVYYPVQVAGLAVNDYSKYDLEENAMPVSEQQRIKPGALGTLALESTSSALHKENRQYVRVLSFEYLGSAKFGKEYMEKTLEEMKQIMPLGFSAEPDQWSWGGERAKRQYSLLLILLAGIFFICAILFENLRQPVLLVLLIPFSFVGLFVTFGWFDFYFDQGGYAAFVMLGGLTVNAGIFIIHDLQQRRTGASRRNVIKAVAAKAQPILLTILSTCFGLIPFIIHGQNEVFWFSLAVGTIGGLLFSLIGVFVLLPVWLSNKSSSVR